MLTWKHLVRHWGLGLGATWKQESFMPELTPPPESIVTFLLKDQCPGLGHSWREMLCK